MNNDETAVRDELLADPDPLGDLSPEEAAVGAKLLPLLTAKISATVRAEYGAEYRTQFDALQAANTVEMRKAIDGIRKAAEPLSKDEIGHLLSQEYGEFTVSLAGPGNATVQFTIRELPADAEKELTKAVRASVGPLLQVISSDEWASLAGASQLERFQKIIDLVPGAVDVLGACVATCLDPKKQHSHVTGPWVTETLSLGRMFSILVAQITAGNYRDFFSLACRLYQQNRMTTA